MDPLTCTIQIPFPPHAQYCGILEHLEHPDYVEVFAATSDRGIATACQKFVVFKSIITEHGGSITNKKWGHIKEKLFWLFSKRQFALDLIVKFPNEQELEAAIKQLSIPVSS
ncbi:MAG: hypothetical protein FWC79_01640 [Oscillospiraceae bacterium]|nr:hypothetical protein [Oscillospiraceae bacterium]